MGTTHLPGLNRVVAGLPVYKWLQFGSGVLGLLVLAIWFAGWLRRTPRGPEPVPSETTDGRRRLAWLMLAAAVVIAAPTVWSMAREPSLEQTAFLTLTWTVGVLGLVVVLLCLVWPTPKPVSKSMPTQAPKPLPESGARLVPAGRLEPESGPDRRKSPIGTDRAPVQQCEDATRDWISAWRDEPMGAYADEYARSVDDREAFWTDQAESVDWFTAARIVRWTTARRRSTAGFPTAP